MEIYTTISEAKKEIWNRWNDKHLRKEVKSYLKEIPDFIKAEPMAVLWKNVGTLNMDYLRFLKLAEQVKLKPVVLEYLQDKFVSRNRDKYALGRMPLYRGKNKNGQAIITYRNVIDMSSSDGKRIAELQTLWGGNFVDFHHQILNYYSPQKVNIFDMSDWFKMHGGNAIGYYKYELSVFLCYGILFEDFLTDDKERQFTSDIVLPAIEKIKSLFGLKPFIIPISDDPSDVYCWCYPEYIDGKIKGFLQELKN